MSYDVNEHRHRFSVWAAARAAQRGLCDVDRLRKALEGCGVVEFVRTANLDDVIPARYVELHRTWCEAVIASLEADGVPNVTFGRAAKLIAMYIKSAVVLGPDADTAFARVAHPPIDGILLRNIAASKKVDSPHKSAWGKTRWTKLGDSQYYELIEQLQSVLGADKPLWMLEQFWTVTNDSERYAE